MKNICVHCGEEGKESFLLDPDQLKKRCLTKVYTCCPIYVSCLGSGKKVVTYGSANKLEARKEKETIAKKKKTTK